MGQVFNIAHGEADCQTLITPQDRIEITVGDGGQFALTVAAAMNGNQTITASLGRDAKLYLTLIDLNCAGLIRHTDIRLSGQGAECFLSGLYIARGDERVENFTSIRHEVPHCTSDQKFHGIATDRASTLFKGLIYVAPDAQQTVALQENHNICLSDTAKVFTEPKLEIYADDVKCNHGATVGRRDEQAIFYMRQRGLSQSDAQAMLLESFALTIINEKIDPSIREAITQMIHRL